MVGGDSMQITRTSPSPPTLQRWDSVFITNGENGRMEKLTRVSEANRVSRVSRVSTFYICTHTRTGVYMFWNFTYSTYSTCSGIERKMFWGTCLRENRGIRVKLQAGNGECLGGQGGCNEKRNCFEEQSDITF